MGQLALERLSDLLEDHAAALELFARQWCATPEDVVQESFLKLVQQPEAPENVVAWLYRVVRNGAISAARSADRRRRHEAVAAERTHSWFEPSPGEALDGRAATDALRELPNDQREIVVAHLWGGLTFDEIAEMTSCSAATAYRRYVAGLTTLRERLGVECPTKSTTKKI